MKIQKIQKFDAPIGPAVAHVLIDLRQPIEVGKGEKIQRSDSMYCLWITRRIISSPACLTSVEFLLQMIPWGSCRCDGGSWRRYFYNSANLEEFLYHQEGILVQDMPLISILYCIEQAMPHIVIQPSGYMIELEAARKKRMRCDRKLV